MEKSALTTWGHPPWETIPWSPKLIILQSVVRACQVERSLMDWSHERAMKPPEPGNVQSYKKHNDESILRRLALNGFYPLRWWGGGKIAPKDSCRFLLANFFLSFPSYLFVHRFMLYPYLLKLRTLQMWLLKYSWKPSGKSLQINLSRLGVKARIFSDRASLSSTF